MNAAPGKHSYASAAAEFYARAQEARTVMAIIDMARSYSHYWIGESCRAFAPIEHGDVSLSECLSDAGWEIRFVEGDYWWKATDPYGARIECCEGDLNIIQ
ncbi:hypothetical protein [Microbacterium sp. NPDC055455]